jgi:group I intron endonuclease
MSQLHKHYAISDLDSDSINNLSVTGIYCITCLINRKCYVGSSINVAFRIKKHFVDLKSNRHINQHLQNAYNLYGLKAFTVYVAETCGESELLDREQYYIDINRSYDRNFGFNQTVSSRSPLGYKHSEESKIKMSLAKLGKKPSQETINLRAKALTGRKMTEEFKRKMSIARKGSDNPMWGKKMSPERKAQAVKALLSVPRWNIGKTKHNDPIMRAMSEKLVNRKSFNRTPHKLVDITNGNSWEAESLMDLAVKTPVSLATLNRIKMGVNGKKTKKYQLLYIQ